MKLRLFGITWFPLLGFWAFLLALADGREFSSSGFYIPFLTYVITSSVFIFLAQVELSRRQGDAISVISKLNSLLICLFISSLIILFNTLAASDNELWTSILIAIPLIINFIIYSLLDYQDEQLTKGFDSRSKTRNESLSVIKDWEKHLLFLSREYKENDILLGEIKRIQNIVNYSSFFRSEESKDLLIRIKSNSEINKLIDLFSEVK
tara:strand:- start:49 stop:672 length:624 start_codon:yes stop_codon:yes gene_type:complete